MRCEQCGAHNPDAAAWCNLCFSDLRATASRSDEARPEDSAVPAHARFDPVPDDEPVAAPPSAADGSAGFRRHDGRLEWECPTCGGWVDIEATACPDCGTPFRARLAADDPAAANDRGPIAPARRTLVLNALLPGLGHLLAGWPGSGLARLVLFSVWVIGGVGLLGAGGTLVASPLLLGAFVLWLTAIHDGWQLGQRGPQILSGRVLLWLVAAVTVLAIIGVAGAAATRSAG